MVEHVDYDGEGGPGQAAEADNGVNGGRRRRPQGGTGIVGTAHSALCQKVPGGANWLPPLAPVAQGALS